MASLSAVVGTALATYITGTSLNALKHLPHELTKSRRDYEQAKEKGKLPFSVVFKNESAKG